MSVLVTLWRRWQGMSFGFYRDIPFERLAPKFTDSTSHFQWVQGLRLHYRMEGKGPFVILLHGTGSSLHTWQAWTERLREQYTVVRIDLPGFGLTGPFPNGGDYRVSNYVRILKEFCKELEITKFCLVGNSLGGEISWHYALSFPQDLEKLTLIGPSFATEGSHMFAIQMGRMPILGKCMIYFTPKAFVRKSLEDCYGDISRITPALVEHYHLLALRQGNRRGFVARCRAPGEDRSKEIPRIQTPTLVLWGEKDHVNPFYLAKHFADLPHGRIISYPHAGHVPMEEIPEESLQDLLQFLKNG